MATTLYDIFTNEGCFHSVGIVKDVQMNSRGLHRKSEGKHRGIIIDIRRAQYRYKL